MGFGASEKAVTNYTTAFWAEQVHDFWQIFIQRPAILVGNSIGSLISMTVAATYPQMVKGMVMLNLPDASVLKTPPRLRSLFSTLSYCIKPVLDLTKRALTYPILFVPFFRILRHPKVLKPWAQKAYADPTVISDERIHLFAQPCYDQDAAKALRAMINSTSTNPERFSAKALLPQLQIPILLIWGRQDMMVPPKLAPLFSQYNPKLTLIEIDNAGHCPHDECPDQVNQAILDWMNSHNLATMAAQS